MYSGLIDPVIDGDGIIATAYNFEGKMLCKCTIFDTMNKH